MNPQEQNDQIKPNNISQQPQQDTQPQAYAPGHAPANQLNVEPRSLLSALTLTILAGSTGLHQMYLGRIVQAWVRFGIFILAALFSSIGYFMLSSLNTNGTYLFLIGFLLHSVLVIWQIIDVFLVYLTKKDSAGQSLVSHSQRDLKASKILFIVSIVSYSIITIVFLITVAQTISAYSSIQDRARDVRQQSIYNSTYKYN